MLAFVAKATRNERAPVVDKVLLGVAGIPLALLPHALEGVARALALLRDNATSAEDASFQAATHLGRLARRIVRHRLPAEGDPRDDTLLQFGLETTARSAWFRTPGFLAFWCTVCPAPVLCLLGMGPVLSPVVCWSWRLCCCLHSSKACRAVLSILH